MSDNVFRWLYNKYQQWQARRYAAQLERWLTVSRALNDLRKEGFDVD